jgi:peroxiredoxin Q/BCP
MPLIEPGEKAPAFSLKDQNGQLHRLADYAGRFVVLYFYPKDDTPGCTKEACSFRDHLPAFATSRAAVLGISGQSEASKAKFANKYGLTFPLLADENYEVAERYGGWQKKLLYGRTFMGVARTTFLIGPDGRVVKRWDKVKVNGHSEAVLEALEAMPAQNHTA